ncbi:MAG: molybdopterin-dependent oxidoreductase [Candidatus Thorarchaeota archaeon]
MTELASESMNTKNFSSENVAKRVKTVCNLCGRSGCGMVITIKDDKAIKVHGDRNHPESKGILCPKGRKVLDVLYSPERLKYPLRRVGSRGMGKWERISWDEALDSIAKKLQEIRIQYGPEAVWFHKGSGHDVCSGDIRSYLHRLANAFGTPNISCPFYICYGPRVFNMFMMTGGIPAPDVENSNTILLWGNNPTATALPRHMKIQKAIQRGAKLIVIDPRKIPLASKADYHLQLRPGTDGALALGLLKVIIDDALYDDEFVKNWTNGFEELRILLNDYSLETIETITWVPKDEIKKAAHLYAKTKPGCIFLGNALDQHTNSSQAIRAITSLMVLTGNLDIPGGNILLSPGRLAKNPVELFDILPQEMDQKRLGKDFPLTQFEFTKLAHPPSAINAILDENPYPIKAMFIMAANPILTSPNTSKIRKAFKKLDFLVVTDIFMTKTAELADIVLPACTFLEQTYYAMYESGADLKPTIPGLLLLRPQVIPPLEESRPDWQIIFDLAKKLGYESFFPWKDIEEAIDYELKPTGITSRDLRQHPDGVRIRGPSFLYLKFGNKGRIGKLLIRLLNKIKFNKYPYMYQKYKKMGFLTPSKKVELFSERLQDLGLDPLPVYHEPSETPLGNSNLAKDYPFVLTTGAKAPNYVHSQMRNIPSLNKQLPYNVLEIHPDTALSLGIGENEMVVVESPRNSIKCQARLTMNIHPLVVQLYHGFEEANANLLTDSDQMDPITGSVPLRSGLCRIFKCA